mmetsp:Transcript_85406/g.151318  ORF Transcript_85406/g.151318 Transcript_85406/m.151318 type:complete len:236 (+) Transcript_85406:133-840(+)
MAHAVCAAAHGVMQIVSMSGLLTPPPRDAQKSVAWSYLYRQQAGGTRALVRDTAWLQVVLCFRARGPRPRSPLAKCHRGDCARQSRLQGSHLQRQLGPPANGDAHEIAKPPTARPMQGNPRCPGAFVLCIGPRSACRSEEPTCEPQLQQRCRLPQALCSRLPPPELPRQRASRRQAEPAFPSCRLCKPAPVAIQAAAVRQRAEPMEGRSWKTAAALPVPVALRGRTSRQPCCRAG